MVREPGQELVLQQELEALELEALELEALGLEALGGEALGREAELANKKATSG